jgi:hypothetical protein
MGGTAAAAGAAAMAAAGPAAIAGALIIIGQGVYGVFKGAQARDQQRDDYRRVTGEAYSQNKMDDPTGMGLGRGAMYEDAGHKFFLPEKHYANLNRKNTQGEYGHFSEFSDAQGSYGYWQNPEDQSWNFGSFGGEGMGNFAMSAGSFKFQDYDTVSSDWSSKLSTYSSDRQRDARDDSILYAGQAKEGYNYDDPNRLAKLSDHRLTKMGWEANPNAGKISGGEAGGEAQGQFRRTADYWRKQGQAR